MFDRAKQWIIGPPLPTKAVGHVKLNKIRALAAFSPDALSSIAYANQEIYLGLIVAGSAGLSLAWPIGLAIAGLLAVVAASYYQTIQAYPSGGGSYLVARENLGTLPGLLVAAALIFDYLMTAAVSLTAGVEALASAFPILWEHKVIFALVLLLILTLLNLRGLQDTGSVMSLPVYLFLIVYLPMLVWGGIYLFRHGSVGLSLSAPSPTSALSFLLVMHAFASGCTALSGIEAISDNVPAFKAPEAKNAGRTLLVMAILMGVLFVGSIGLTQSLSVIAGPQETILSALARRLLGSGPLYILVQVSTMAILAVAANTSFAGFPRMAAILSADGFLPRQLTSLGDRLVYSNGIVFLSAATGFLIIAFNGDSHSLIPLFAVGVFLAFTLSQAGMVLHWVHTRGRYWLLKSTINGIGTLATFLAFSIIGFSKFLHGAWITVIIIPGMVYVFFQIKNHYREVAKELTLKGLPPSLRPLPPPRLVIPISGVHRGTIEAVNFARSLSPEVTALYVALDEEVTKLVQERWLRWFPDLKLAVVPSPYRSIVQPILDYLDQTDIDNNDGQQAVLVLPEFVPAHAWQALLHNQTALLLRAALLYRRRYHGFQRAIIDVPFHLKR
jgi:amino acid transporter